MFRDEEGMSTSPFSVGTFSLPFVLQANSKTEIKPRREMLLLDGYFLTFMNANQWITNLGRQVMDFQSSLWTIYISLQ